MLTIYTAIFGNTYKLQPPECALSDARYLCFTDNARNAAKGVETVIVPPPSPIPELAAKWYKWHPPEGDSLYIDSAYQLTAHPQPWFNGLSRPLGLCAHAARRCVFYESKVVQKYRPYEAKAIGKQVSRYRRRGLPPHFGLWEGGIIFRREDSAVSRWNERVWREITTGSIRDQLAIPFCLWSLKLECDTLPSHLPQMVRQHRQLW